MRRSHSGDQSDRDERGKLGFFLCWAVVFADIGTSVYDTPGILYGQVGRLAGFFVSRVLFCSAGDLASTSPQALVARDLRELVTIQPIGAGHTWPGAHRWVGCQKCA